MTVAVIRRAMRRHVDEISADDHLFSLDVRPSSWRHAPYHHLSMHPFLLLWIELMIRYSGLECHFEIFEECVL